VNFVGSEHTKQVVASLHYPQLRIVEGHATHKFAVRKLKKTLIKDFLLVLGVQSCAFSADSRTRAFKAIAKDRARAAKVRCFI
jgi:hypothetical protein